MAANNFKALQEEMEQANPVPPQLEDRIMSNLDMFAILGQATEMYLPMLLETFGVWMGGGEPRLEASKPREFGDLPGFANPATDKNTDSDLPGFGKADDPKQ